MTSLRFHLPGPVDLPVEVFDGELRLVGRALSSDSLAVGPGTYFAEARLPDGSRLRRAVEVGAEDMQVVPLGPRPEARQSETEFFRSPERQWTPSPTTFGRSMEPSLKRVRAYQPLEPSGVFVTFRLGGVGGWQVTSARGVHAGSGRVEVSEADAVGLQRHDGTTVVIPLPGKSASLMRFLISTGDDGEIGLDAHLIDVAADALLQYLSLDLLDDARLMADSRALEGEMLLSAKVEDPLAAAAGALALLRMNRLDRLHDWTVNLAEWFTWLPDGVAILAEHLGRVGRHEEAAGLLRTLPLRGLPVLSFSLVLAVNRLRTYAAYWPDDETLDRALTLLTGFALVTDFSIPVTTFLSDNPDSPEPARLSDSPGAGSDEPEAVGVEETQRLPQEYA